MLPKIQKARRVALRAKNKAMSLIPSSRQASLLKSVRNSLNPLPQNLRHRLSGPEQRHIISQLSKVRQNPFKERLLRLEHFARFPKARLSKQIGTEQGRRFIAELFSFGDPYSIENAKVAVNAIEKSDISVLRQALLAEYARIAAASTVAELHFSGLNRQ